MDGEIFVDDDHTQRDVVSANYQAVASNASLIGKMLTGLGREIDYGVAVELSVKANEVVQQFHDAIGCLRLESDIAKRENENEADREMLRDIRARLKPAKRKKK